MENYNTQENRAFQKMRQAALDRLWGRDPLEIEENTGIPFSPEASAFYLSTLGKNVTIRYPEYQMNGELGEWHQLVILHYMDMADQSRLTGRQINFGALPGGMIRGGGFDRLCEQTVSREFGNWAREKLETVSRSLGGRIFPSNAEFLRRVFRSSVVSGDIEKYGLQTKSLLPAEECSLMAARNISCLWRMR